MGPARPRSTVLTEAEEAMVVEFRRRTLLPLDDVLGCLRDAIPALTRSALHRCLVRHGISRLPRDGEKASKRQRFAETAIGYVHIDACELRLAEGKLFLFLAIDRVTKFVHVGFFDANTKANGAAFLREAVEAFPYAIHTVLTDNGMAFADLPKYRDGPTARWMGHIFDRVCRENGIEHRLTKPYHPWTTDEFEQPLFASGAIFLRRVGDRAAKSGARGWGPRRAAYDGRSSSAAPTRAGRGPFGCQPPVRRPYAASPSAARRRSASRVAPRL
jgi:transposase InsO family protein